MNLKQKKQMLWTATAVLVAATVIAVASTFMLPLESAESSNQPGDGRLIDSSLDNALPAIAQFADVWSLDLRKPIYDAPPPAKVEKKKSPLQAKLVGIAAEDPSNSTAFFTVKGSTVMAGVGDKVGAEPDMAVVKEITPEKVVLEYQGNEMILTFDKEESK